MYSLSRLGAPLLAALMFSGPALADIEISDAFVRATPPGVDVSAAFFRVHNTGGDDRTLTGASTDKAATVELHTHSEQDGVMKMRRIDGIEIPAHHDHRLAPGGDHLMLIGLTQPLVDGDRVELTLQFSSGDPVIVTAPVWSAQTEMDVENRIEENKHHHKMP
ncbi:MAG: copper chaperone PCu(A)C [Oceanospirillaceae bacterium]|nr:copper chaperone PCu(A)C [Oceanospirillaceae bacterium]